MIQASSAERLGNLFVNNSTRAGSLNFGLSDLASLYFERNRKGYAGEAREGSYEILNVEKLSLSAKDVYQFRYNGSA